MKGIKVFEHQFVEYIPDELKESIVYISITYGTVIHLCACGCRNQVVTPLSPAQWQIIYDGLTISLTPSIGNWDFPCQSHYWLENGEIVWADKWSKKDIKAGRRRDRKLLDVHYEKEETAYNQESSAVQIGKKDDPSCWNRILQKLKMLWRGLN